MMASSKPKHCYQIFSYSDLGVLVGCLWEGASNLNVVLSESRRGKNDEQKWRKKNRKAAPEREIDGLQENVSEAKRSKKDVYIYSSMQSARLCFQALGDVLKAVMMNASFLSHHS